MLRKKSKHFGFVELLIYRLHAWGETMEEAFEQCAMAMFGYMTELDKVEMTQSYEIEAEAEDLPGLLFHFLDELLFMFCAEPYLVARVSLHVIPLVDFDESPHRLVNIKAVLSFGTLFSYNLIRIR